MPFSQACKYCVRAVLYLAQHGSAKPLMTRQIAQALDIPEPFLAKILQQLSKQGFLRSFKGRGGGFMLARPAREIRLLEVVRAVEGSQFGENCVLGLPECTPENPCPLHQEWSKIKEELLEMLRRHSAEDMQPETPARRPRGKR